MKSQNFNSYRANLLFGNLLAILVIFGLLAWPLSSSPAQASGLPQAGQTAGVSWDGSPAFTETTAQIMARQSSAARLGKQPTAALPNFRYSPAKHAGAAPLVPASVSNPALPLVSPPVFTLGTSFNGPESGTNPCGTPPDTMGTVGPTQFIIFLNCNIVSYDKSTGAADGVLNTTPDVFFASVRSASASDPHIRYDRLSQRWFVVMIDVTFPNNRVLLAVSDTATITNLTVWSRYFFQSAVGTHTSCLADYPTPGIDANAIYIGVNQFCGPNINAATYSGSDAYVVQKSSVLSGGPIHVTGFASIATTSNGPYTPQGVDNADPAATTGYFIGVDNAVWNQLDLVPVNNPGGATPTLGAVVFIATANMGTQITQPHKGNTGGSNGELDASDNRLFSASMRFGSIWTATGVGVSSTCLGVASGTANRDAIFWWQIGGIGATPAVTQAGTICDTTATNPAFYSYGTIMVNGQGHAAVGYTVAGVNNFTEPGVSVRLTSDASGTLPTAYISPVGTHPYNPPFDSGTSSGMRRWGDFSYTSLDPCDDMTLWTIQEYASSDNVYGERVTKLVVPPPAQPASANPIKITAGLSSVPVTITGTSSSGSGFYDTPASMSAESCRKRISAAVSGGVTVNSITYTDPTHVTLDLNTTAATAGAQTVTITNPDGQSAAAAILTVGQASQTTLTADVNPSLVGQTVTFTATVSGSGATPTGSVAFSDNGALLANVSLASGKATFTTSTLTVGSHPIAAAYSGDGTYASSSGNLGQTVNKTPTLVKLSSSLNPAGVGVPVTLTATVTSTSGLVPVGTVTFTIDGTPLAPITLDGAGIAHFSTSALTLGAHPVSVVFDGSANFVASAPDSLSQQISLFTYLPGVAR